MSEQETIARKTEVMLGMQNEMNCAVDADWLAHDRAWYRAIWIECAELMDHYGGWKWWKHSETDVEQSLLEIVDIWHFGLSLRISADEALSDTAARIAGEWFEPLASQGFLADVETLAEYALHERGFKVAVVPALLAALKADFDDLYRHYVGKNVLNLFRQDHGYKTGSYIKTWQGREDNEHLSDILASLDVNSEAFREDVRKALQARYPG